MVSEESISAGQSLEDFSKANSLSGAIVSFSGQVRRDAHDGGTQALYLQAYEPVTREMIEKKRLETIERWGLDDAYIRHRTGHMKPADTIVFVATAAKHRRDAFLAADFLMDYLKTEAFFWKKEIGTTGAKWVEPTDADYCDAKRWSPAAKEE